MSWFTLCVMCCMCVLCVVSIELGLLGIVLVKYHNKLKSEILGTFTLKVPVCPS